MIVHGLANAFTSAAYSSRRLGNKSSGQQPGGDTPGVAAAPVELAGAIMPGVARFIVMLSAQADEFGVGITAVDASRLVVTSGVISGWIVPGDRLAGMSGVESGKAAPLVGGPPGIVLHTVFDALPIGDTGGMVPVVLVTMDVEMVPKGVDDVVVGIIAIAPLVMDTGPVLDTIDGNGKGGTVMEGEGRGRTVGCGGAGMVVPGR